METNGGRICSEQYVTLKCRMKESLLNLYHTHTRYRERFTLWYLQSKELLSLSRSVASKKGAKRRKSQACQARLLIRFVCQRRDTLFTDA